MVLLVSSRASLLTEEQQQQQQRRTGRLLPFNAESSDFKCLSASSSKDGEVQGLANRPQLCRFSGEKEERKKKSFSSKMIWPNLFDRIRLKSSFNYLKLKICPRAALTAVLGEPFHIRFALKLQTEKIGGVKPRCERELRSDSSAQPQGPFFPSELQ